MISFSVGYMLAFIGLASILNAGAVAIPKLSLFLQRVISSFLGPIMIFEGMALSGLIDLTRFYSVIRLRQSNYYLTKGSPFPTILLGALLALTFCPATASIFFGILVPLSLKNDQLILFPILYALGALIPIITISILIFHGVVSRIQKNWTKKIPLYAGWLMVLIGIYMTINQLYL